MAALPEEWWDRQREICAPSQLSLGQEPASSEDRTFEYIARTRLTLSDRPERRMPRSDHEIRIKGSGPPPQEEEQENVAASSAPAPAPRKPLHPSVPAFRKPMRGAVADRLHPHHPVHSEPRSTRHAEAWDASAAAPPPHARQRADPPSPPAVPTPTPLHLPPSLLDAEAARLAKEATRQLKTRRHTRPDARPHRAAERPSVRPAWSSPTSHPKLFDASLHSRTLREEERAARAQREGRAARWARRADAAEGSLVEIEAHLRRVRAQLDRDFGAAHREHPFYQACLRRLARLEAELRVLKQPGALHHHGIRLTRMLLIQELRKLSRDIRLAMEDPGHAYRSSPRAPGAGGGSAARHRTVRYEWDGSPSPAGSPQRTPHDEMQSRASSPGKGWRDPKLTIATPPSPSSKPATRPTTPHDSPRKSPGPPSFRRTPSGRAVSWTEDDLRGWFEQKLESFAEQASAARAEMDARQLAQQRTLEELLGRLAGGGGVEGGAPSTDSVEAMRALADELWAGETGWHAASKQVGSQADSRKRMELHSALQLLQQVEREREEMRLRWFGGGGEAVNPLREGWREGEGKEPWRQQESVSSSCDGRRAAAAQGGVVWVPDGPLDPDGSAAPSGGTGAASHGGAASRGVAYEATSHGGAVEHGGAGGGTEATQRVYHSATRTISAAVQTSIWQAKRQYEASLEESGLPEPWSLVERLADEVLEDVLQNCAESMYVACNEAVEMVAEAEFTREA